MFYEIGKRTTELFNFMLILGNEEKNSLSISKNMSFSTLFLYIPCRTGKYSSTSWWLTFLFSFNPCYLTVVEFLTLEIQPTFFYKISPGLPFSMYIIMVRRKNALRNEITEKTEFVYFFFLSLKILPLNFHQRL